ncbi:hypothetical protein IV102_18465 [bacterium]|nr:hypothetical protein [bacterium]
MAMPLPHSLSPSTAKDAWKQYKTQDNRAGDADARPDFVQWSNGEQKVEVYLTPNGFLARQSEPTQVQVTQCSIPRWLGQSEVQTICRTAQGAYSGFLGGLPIIDTPDSQDSARKGFYEWQKPLQKPDG